MPQVLPVIAGQVLYFIESNTRSATIIGIVGAGGIGLQLAEQIRVLEWQKVSFLILMILVAVAAIDWISEQSSALRSSGGARSPELRQVSSRPRNSTRSAAKRERFVTSGVPSASTSVLSTTRTGRPSARSSRAASVASTMAAVIRVEDPPVVADAVMRRAVLSSSVRAGEHLSGVGKALGAKARWC